MPITGTALKSVVRFSTEQTSRSRKEIASGAETRRRRRRAEAVLMSTRSPSVGRRTSDWLVNARTSVRPLWQTPCGHRARVRLGARLRVRSGCISAQGPVGADPPDYLRSVAMFRLQGSKVLAVDMTGDAVKAKNGSMVAYDGQMAFKKMSGGGEGIRGMVTRRLTGEQMTLMEVKGHGTCCFADRASEINLVALQGDKLYVESSNLLVTDAGLRTGTTLHRAARRPRPGQRSVHHDRRGHAARRRSCRTARRWCCG